MNTNQLISDPKLIRALARLNEEAAEVVKATSKMMRFGLRPYNNGVQYDNVSDLSKEMADCIRRMTEAANELGIQWIDIVLASGDPKPAPDDQYEFEL